MSERAGDLIGGLVTIVGSAIFGCIGVYGVYDMYVHGHLDLGTAATMGTLAGAVGVIGVGSGVSMVRGSTM